MNKGLVVSFLGIFFSYFRYSVFAVCEMFPVHVQCTQQAIGSYHKPEIPSAKTTYPVVLFVYLWPLPWGCRQWCWNGRSWRSPHRWWSPGGRRGAGCAGCTRSFAAHHRPQGPPQSAPLHITTAVFRWDLTKLWMRSGQVVRASDCGDKVNSGGLSYRPASVCSPAVRYDNPMPELNLELNFVPAYRYDRQRLGRGPARAAAAPVQSSPAFSSPPPLLQ